ncbi:MAG: hypothetical protein ACRD4U_11880 [Candidatus Acidiferrales bacterium]
MTLKARIAREGRDRVRIEISRDDFEAFCNSLGRYRKEFLRALEASEEDHRRGRTRVRKSLRELIR